MTTDILVGIMLAVTVTWLFFSRKSILFFSGGVVVVSGWLVVLFVIVKSLAAGWGT